MHAQQIKVKLVAINRFQFDISLYPISYPISRTLPLNLWHSKLRFWCNRIHRLKYLRSTTLGCKDIGIWTPEFVAKTWLHSGRKVNTRSAVQAKFCLHSTQKLQYTLIYGSSSYISCCNLSIQNTLYIHNIFLVLYLQINLHCVFFEKCFCRRRTRVNIFFILLQITTRRWTNIF